MTRIIALAGVPGTGKTSVGRALSSTYPVLDGLALAHELGAVVDHDADRDAHIVDEDLLRERARDALAKHGDVVVVEGVVAHHADPDVVVVLRCRPTELAKRLAKRSWSDAKVAENLDAERLDAIAFDVDAPETYELDTTGADATEIADLIARLIQGETVKDPRLGGLGAFDFLEG